MEKKDSIYLFLSDEGGCFIVIKSPSKHQAKEKLKVIVRGHGLYNWQITRLDEEEHTNRILAKYDLNCLYYQDADYSASEGLIAHA
jgi:hypothetical protein